MVQIVKYFLGSGATKRSMSKHYDLKDKSFHGLPKFISKANVIQVGNGTKC